jgi:CubicO group peptidase (beta-lactamase class C family)
MVDQIVDDVPSLPNAMRAITDGIVENLHIGAQLYVSRSGVTVADLGIGEARSSIAMRPDHLMLWMSTVKPVTAIAIAQMWERGLLAIDDPVARHLPEFAANGKSAVTIRHVLTHTGGFPKAALQWSAATWEKVIEEICAAPLEAEWIPGRTAGYHVASGWYILGEIVRRLDGRPYSRYVREAIFEPLGMHDSWLGMPANEHREYGDRIVAMHTYVSDTERPRPFKPNWDPPYRFWSGSQEACATCRPGGSAWGPVRELGHFYEALLAGGKGIVRPQTIEAMTTRHTAGLHDKTFGYPLDRGLGVVVDSKKYGAGAAWFSTRCSPRTFGHAGAWSSIAFADPEYQLVVALGFNGMIGTNPPKHDARVAKILDALYDDLGIGDR